MGEGTTTRTKRTSKVIGRRAHSTHHVVVTAHGCRVPLAILLLASLVVLLPLAAADASDPTWLAGVYDEADGDGVWLVDMMRSMTHIEAPGVRARNWELGQPFRALGLISVPCMTAFSLISISACTPRGPPPISLLGNSFASLLLLSSTRGSARLQVIPLGPVCFRANRQSRFANWSIGAQRTSHATLLGLGIGAGSKQAGVAQRMDRRAQAAAVISTWWPLRTLARKIDSRNAPIVHLSRLVPDVAPRRVRGYRTRHFSGTRARAPPIGVSNGHLWLTRTDDDFAGEQ